MLARLGVRVGDEVLLRVEKPSLLSRDAPLSTVEDGSVTLRLPVAAVAADRDFGRFSLEANQIPPLNAFVPLERLQRAIGMRGILVDREGRFPEVEDRLTDLYELPAALGLTPA